MFKRLLVPLDGSELAESALPAARFLAEKCGSRVSLVHLIEKGRPSTVHEQPHLHDANEAAAYLSRIAASFPPDSAEVHVHREEVSRVGRSIAEHGATELGADLVVMCAHGAAGVLRFAQGSIAQQVIAAGTIPVLAVHAPTEPARQFSCGKILLPLDGKEEHGDILGFSKDFAACCGAAVRIISVVPTQDTIPGKWSQVGRLLPGATAEMFDIEADSLKKLVESAAAALREKGRTAEAAVLRGDPGRAIALDSEESGAGVIIMATHGKSGIAALWEGSVAPRVFAQTLTPLLLVPALSLRGPVSERRPAHRQ
jgi:nucleotide-binding universal stress UspA family protein